MILLLDAGNTRLKWAWWDGERLHDHGEIAHGGDPRALRQASWTQGTPPQRVLVSNVAGQWLEDALRETCEYQWGIVHEPLAPAGEAFGVRNAYTEPQRLGADRWASLIAAHHLIGADVCIVDCGSAVTIDVVTADGGHQGGLILPGLAMMRRCLNERTDGVRQRREGDAALLARDTDDAVAGGTLYTLIAALDRITADLAGELGAELVRVITGGDAPDLLPLLAGTYRHEPDLVLRGLAVVAQGTA